MEGRETSGQHNLEMAFVLDTVLYSTGVGMCGCKAHLVETTKNLASWDENKTLLIPT